VTAPVQRFLGVDVGGRRTGLAAGDTLMRMAMPVGVLHVPKGPALMDALVRAVHEHAPDAIVVGLPLNMDGTEGGSAKEARAFAGELQTRTGLTVHLQDERLTTFDADQRMARSGLTHGQKKELRDALAAAALLQDFLNRDGPTYRTP
jgi:putative Holliday junction resolvase